MNTSPFDLIEPISTPYVGNPQLRLRGFRFSEFIFILDLTKANSRAIPLGIAVEGYVSNGIVLGAVVRKELSEMELHQVGKMMRGEMPHISTESLSRHFSAAVDHLPKESETSLGFICERLKHNVYQLRSSEELPNDLVKSAGLSVDLRHTECIEGMRKLLWDLSNKSFFQNLVPAFRTRG